MRPAILGMDTRTVAHISGLAAGGVYPYRVKLGGRTLAEAELHTNKPAGEPISFIVFGDSGKATKEQYELAAKMTIPPFQKCVSEPLGEVPGVWNEVPESSWGVVQPGRDELHAFRPAVPANV